MHELRFLSFVHAELLVAFLVNFEFDSLEEGALLCQHLIITVNIGKSLLLVVMND